MSTIRSVAGNLYSADCLWPIFDFKTILQPHVDKVIAKKIKVTRCHQFKINWEGIRTKQFAEEDWSDWRGNVNI